MNVIENMLMIYNTTRTEDTNHRILNIWLNSLKQIPSMKIAELADFSFTSPSTVLRLIAILGFHKYTVFAHALQSCLNQYPGLNRFTMPFYDHGSGNGQEMFLSYLESSISEIRRLSRSGCFGEIARDMHQHSSVCIFSYPAMFCEFNLQFDLFMSGVSCEVIPYDAAKLEYSKNMKDGAYVLAFYPDRLDDLAIIKEILSNAKKRGSKITLVSSCSHLDDKVSSDTFIRFHGNTAASDAFFCQMFISVLTIEYRKMFLD